MARGQLLVLDDDATVGQILVMAAQAAGFEAQRFEDLPAFMNSLATCTPTHVVVDLCMPGISPDQVLQALANQHCPAWVIVCSGAPAHEMQAALGLAAGLGLKTAGVLAKPFRLAELRELLAC